MVAAITPRLPEVFSTLPQAPVEIRRVPVSIEIGAPGGYYQAASLDGSRPGAYYINLRDTANRPKWSLPTLTYHEAVPGHHFQISVAREAGTLPIYRRASGFSAYNEGWALYSERVAADDLDMYEGDPLGRIGYLQAYLFRAVRLVVDTGLHDKRWSREQAIAYMIAEAGDARELGPVRGRSLHRLAGPGLLLQAGPDRDRGPAPGGRGQAAASTSRPSTTGCC